MDAVVWEDVVRLTCLAFTFSCAVYNVYCTLKRSTASHIKNIMNWYVSNYERGNISEEKFLKGMRNLKELAENTKKDSTTTRPQNKSEE